MKNDSRHLLAVARGDEPADVLFRNARLVNVFSGEIEHTDVALAGTRIAGVGPGYDGREIVDLEGSHLCPGLIDAHVHIESSMMPPSGFAALVVPRGVTAVVSDPHEIANVLGLEGVRFMVQDARGCPLTVYFNAPSCVPSSPLAGSGASLDAADLAELLSEDAVLGLAEVMDFPAVIAGQDRVLDKVRAFAGRPVDGHSPGLAGQALNAYVAAGIQSDHECTSIDEARRKLRLGITIFMRQGSVARDLETLLPLVDPSNERRFCFCTDDRQIPDLIAEGSIDHLIRMAVGAGLDPLTAVRMATLNPATHFGLTERGAVAPGRLADLVVVDDLHDFRARQVWVAGRLAARDGAAAAAAAAAAQPSATGNTVHVDWSRVDLRIPVEGRKLRAIGVAPHQLLTENLVVNCSVEDGSAVSDPQRDLLKVAVIERHKGSGRIGRGFVRGMGLQRGAIAGTVAHDHHNLIVVGADDASMLRAARAVEEAGGGLAAAEGDRLLGMLSLPIAGLMSDRAPQEVARELDDAIHAARELGSELHDPFMTMSFLGLEVIPSLKLTDQGLVDVERMQVVPLFV